MGKDFWSWNQSKQFNAFVFHQCYDITYVCTVQRVTYILITVSQAHFDGFFMLLHVHIYKKCNNRHSNSPGLWGINKTNFVLTFRESLMFVEIWKDSEGLQISKVHDFKIIK